MPTSNFSWMTHILGLERLFALRGPVMTGSSHGLDNIVLNICRPVMILAAFFTQRPSLMSSPEWKVTPLPHYSAKTPVLYQLSDVAADMSTLMGILAELPPLYIECDRCVQSARKRSSPPSMVPSAAVWTKTRQLYQEAQVWKQKWSKINPNNPRDPFTMSKFDLPEFTTNWATAYVFETAEIAMTFSMYHSMNILLLSIPASLYRADLLPPPSMPSKTRSSSSDFDFYFSSGDQQLLLSEFKTSIHSICRSIEYHFHALPPAQAPADYHLFFPIHVARRASMQLGYASEFAWLSAVYERLKARYPMGVWASMDLRNHFSGLEEGLFG